MFRPAPTAVHLRRRLGAGLALYSIPFALLAQTTPQLPNAGAMLQQMQSAPLPQASPPAPQSVQVLPREEPAIAPGGPAIDVAGYRITGVSPERAQALQRLLDGFVGGGKTLLDLDAASKRVENELQQQGLILARVCLPVQQVSGGIVDLQVYEGRLGEVKLEIGPGVKVSRELLERIVAPLREHPVVERGLIEQVLLTIEDLHGIGATSTLKATDEVGVADLEIKIAAGPPHGGSVEYDNAGSIYTGRNRFYAGFDQYNLVGWGDVASLRAQASTGTQYVRAGWLTPINELGTRVVLSASYLTYDLRTALYERMGAEGSAQGYALQAFHPAIRSLNHNLYLQGSVERRLFTDKLEAFGVEIRKDTTLATLGFNGDARDDLWGGGANSYAATASFGHLDINTPIDAAMDELGYRTRGHYAKLNLAASRLQALPNHDYAFLGLQAQVGSNNLDSSEKFSLGGLNGVRGYAPTESPSDAAAVVTWEYRKVLNIPADAYGSSWVASVFGDYGWGQQHKTPLASDSDNTRFLVSHGLGLSYANSRGSFVKLSIAARGNTPGLSDDSHVRFLLQASQQF